MYRETDPVVILVSLQKLGKQLKRELTRNPKKTGVLLLMSLVGVYSWIPLIWKPQEKKFPAVAEADAALVQPLAVVGGNTEVTQNQPPKHCWFTIDQWIENDRNMKTADLPPELLNPFSRRQQEDEISRQQRDQQLAIAQSELTPQELGMSLTSTVISRRLRLAMINGKKYKEQDIVAVSDSSGQAGTSTAETNDGDLSLAGQKIEFQVQQIQRKYVVLVRNDKKYRLSLKQAKLSAGDLIVRRGSSAGERP